MLKRNLAVKMAPQRWQENAADGFFDVVLTFEEKVFDMVVQGSCVYIVLEFNFLTYSNYGLSFENFMLRWLMRDSCFHLVVLIQVEDFLPLSLLFFLLIVARMYVWDNINLEIHLENMNSFLFGV